MSYYDIKKVKYRFEELRNSVTRKPWSREEFRNNYDESLKIEAEIKAEIYKLIDFSESEFDKIKTDFKMNHGLDDIDVPFLTVKNFQTSFIFHVFQEDIFLTTDLYKNPKKTIDALLKIFYSSYKES